MPADLEELSETNVEKEITFGHFISFFQELARFIQRCHTCAHNLVQQLAALSRSKNIFKGVHFDTATDSLAELLALLVTIDVAILRNDALADAWTEYKRIIARLRSSSKDQWANDIFLELGEQRVEQSLPQFEFFLGEIDRIVLKGTCFRACAELDFEHTLESKMNNELDFVVVVRDNAILLAEFERAVKIKLDRALALVGTASETDERLQLVQVAALYCFIRRIAPAKSEPDPKLYRSVWSIEKHVPVITLVGGRALPFFVADFLLEHAPPPPNVLLKKIEPLPNALDNTRREACKRLDSHFETQAKALELRRLTFLAKMQARFQRCVLQNSNQQQNMTTSSELLLEQRGALLLQALALAQSHASLLRSCVALHVATSTPFAKRALSSFASLIDGLKSIEACVCNERSAVIAESLSGALKALAQALLAQLGPLKLKLKERHRKKKNNRLESLAALEAASVLLTSSQTFSSSRLHILGLCLCLAFNDTTAPENSSERKCKERAQALARRLTLLATFETRMHRICDASTLYWSRELLEPTLTAIGNIQRLPHLLSAAADISHVLLANSSTELLEPWKRRVITALDTAILIPLCHHIENDLRVRAHALGASRNSKNTSAPSNGQKEISDHSQLLQVLKFNNLCILDEMIQPRRYVAAYLEKVFYDLTVVALHDWATYAEMRALARQSYGLELRENLLPMGSLDVGLDILRIMQNIHVFVSRFSYNLNQQTFIERRPDRGSKNVRCINIRSIAASLKQHGLGVCDTTVNFTYQFLTQKFHIFSQFLYDDYIRSHLSKERRWFRKHRIACDSMYPYGRAADLVREIRKLGISENDGNSFLDHFRILITEIGNALGYVRMVRSAGAEFCADAAQFVPSFEQAQSMANNCANIIQNENEEEEKNDDAFEKNAQVDDNQYLSSATKGAGKNLAAVIQNLSKNFAEGRDYFQVLVNVFQKVLGDHEHLTNFYTIVPALCLSWVDCQLVAKDRVFKQSRSKDAYFTDDGFAVGIAYILAILDQGNRFDSLHWFDSVKAKILADEAELEQRLATRERKRKAREHEQEQQKKKSSTFSFLSNSTSSTNNSTKTSAKAIEDDDDDDDDDDDSGARALQLTARRIKATKRENELLFFSISGARVFFRRTE
eukprot:CAMPEP_0197310608 /NCGR_PEP_ID=MMETSP0891-20130614/9179_1 /TAXON_ID=44058 ORGANISM="Aureoumbra lagunensis, Strain CCMP1510" /NCGR_SAMPLE_ID=MMETSP0891 /ASSEMBLY_ACC=CAM_ASM_000534 /LENGTH=1136 /DNA_ID=CAMNT_0042796327 /DNA_START=276 /DNA_END=3687 /DNA_ORIENTATION=+